MLVKQTKKTFLQEIFKIMKQEKQLIYLLMSITILLLTHGNMFVESLSLANLLFLYLFFNWIRFIF